MNILQFDFCSFLHVFSLESSKMASSIGSSVNSDNQARTSVSGLKFGPDWMRNPPQQQESIPQRQFALARNRYGREEMLQVNFY